VKYIQKIKEAGLKGSIAYLNKVMHKKYYHLVATVCRYPKYQNPTPSELQHIEKTLVSRNIMPADYQVDVNDFSAFQSDYQFGNQFYGGAGFIYTEKVLEHYIAYDLGLRKMPQGGHYIDIAACNSPWAKLLRDNGYNADAIDLEPSKLYFGLPYYHVIDATQTNFDTHSIDLVSLQCAYEMFLNDDDMKLVRELGRILKPGGIAIICPLYMHIEYCGYCSPEYWHRKDFHDQNAKLYVSANSYGIPFSRKYDVAELQARVLETITHNEMDYKIHILRNGAEIDPQVYCHFILELVKKG
jgi:SAM-dependent methyltransferase